MAIYNVIGNKGGIGKTTISAYLAEYLTDRYEEAPICIDTDLETSTFTMYEPFNTLQIQLKDSKNNIDKGAFDEMIEIILDNADKNIVIDNGSTSFNALSTYMIENDIVDLLKEEEIDHNIVGIVAGGGNTSHSLNGLVSLVNAFDVPFLVWNNELLGLSEYNGVHFENSKAFKTIREKMIGDDYVRIEKESDYIKDDIVNMTKQRLTFQELKASNFKLMQRRRLLSYRDKIWTQLDTILGDSDEER